MFKKTRLCTGLGLAFGASVLLSAMPAAAQQAPQRVEITGSAIKRVDIEGALPVTTITREDIARSGVLNTEDLVANIASMSSMGGVSLATGVGSSTYGRSSISLRGLSGSRTLVLVNGRRLTQAVAGGTSSSVNVNNIPLSAIERVEVLKDGASSLYGSDALAGVVNFILTKDFRGVDLGVSYGEPTRDGGGGSKKASIVAGFGDLSKDRFNLTVSAVIEKEDALFAKDRAFAATGNVPPFISAAATGQGNIQGGWNPGTGSIAGGNWVQGTGTTGFSSTGTTAGFGNPLAAQDKCADIKMFRNVPNGSKGVPVCTYDSAQDVGLIPKREGVAFTANGVFRLTDKLELFGDVLRSSSTATQTFQPSPIRHSFLLTDNQFQALGIDPILYIKPTNPNYAIASAYLNSLLANPAIAAADKTRVTAMLGKPLGITARVFDFGGRSSKDESTQSRLVGGLRGNLGAHDYEIAFSTSENKLHGTVPNGYFSQTAYAKAVQASDEWNPWSLTQTAAFQTAIAPAKYTGTTLDGKAKASSIDGLLRGDVTQLPGGMLQYAAGLQARTESLKTNPSAALFSGDIAGLGGATPPIDRDRKVTSLFGELNAPLLKGLDANLSARGDRYNDVGNSTTYKASLRYQPVKQVLVRAGTGTGFRAPALAELWLPQTLGTSAQFTDPAFPREPDIQVNELSGGNPALKPEKSRQTSIGLVLSPIDQVTVSLDLWKIKVEGLITTASTQEIVSRYRSGDPAYAGFVTLDASNHVLSTVSVLANVGTADLSGVDVEANFRQPLFGGRLDVNLNGTYMIKFDQTTPGGMVSRKVGTMVEANGDPVLEADGGGVVLRWRHRLAATWTTGAWGLTLAQNFYTGYRTGNRRFDGEPHFVPDQSIYDAQVTFSGVKNLKLALGVKNLADKNPPIYVPVSNQFQAGFDVNQYDPRGRFVYMTANYKF